MYSNRKIRQWINVGCSLLLAIAAGYGIVRSTRTATAQWVYKRIKYGTYTNTRFEIPPSKDTRRVLASCERFYRWYPHNYYFFVLTADRAFSESFEAKTQEEFKKLMSSAGYWDRIAFQTNPYNSEVCYTHVRILQETGRIYDAISFWRDVVLEREFWNPDRHEVMIRLYLRAGMISAAIEEVEKNPTWVFQRATRDRVLAFRTMRESASED